MHRCSVDVTATDKEGKSVLHHAAESGNVGVIETFIRLGADVNRVDSKGKTALYYAVHSGSINAMNELVRLGADVNHRDNKGKTALHDAVQSGSVNVINALVGLGADVNCIDMEGKTPLFYRTWSFSISEVVVPLLVGSGANVNHTDNTGQTAFGYAFEKWDTTTIRALAKAGANVNQQRADGKTAVHIASIGGNAELIEQLASSGADVNLADSSGKTPLEYGLDQYNDKVIKALVSAGADINQQDAEGKTLLHRAVQNGRWGPIDMLVRAGADLNRADSEGKTVLHYALERADMGSFRQFVDSGADVNRQDKNGRTVLHYACRRADNRLISALKPFNANPNLVDNDGKTAFDYLLSDYPSLLISFIEFPGLLLDDRAIKAIRSSRIDGSFLRYNLSERLRASPNQNIREFLEAVVEKEFPAQWRADVHSFEHSPFRHFCFQQHPNPNNPNLYQVRTNKWNAAIEKELFFEIVLDVWDVERIGKRLDEYFNDCAIRRPATKYYSLMLHQEELHEHPEKILTTLNELFGQSRASELDVTFVDEQGEDAGGLGRQLISRLFSELCEKMEFEKCENNLYRPILKQNSNGDFLPLSEADRATYRALGNLIMFCLNSSESYPTGMILDQGVLDALKSIQHQDNFDEQFCIFEKLSNYNEGDIQQVKRLKRYLAMADDATLQEIAMVLGIDEDADTMKSHLPSIKDRLQKYILDNMITPRLAPLRQIANGMRDSPFRNNLNFDQLQTVYDSAELSQFLQGTVSKQDIIDRLVFSERIPERVQNLLIDWIQKSDKEMLQFFLFALSGSSALGSDIKIKIEPGSQISFHTCGYQVDLDYENIQTETDLAERFDIAFQAIKADPRFDVR